MSSQDLKRAADRVSGQVIELVLRERELRDLRQRARWVASPSVSELSGR